MRLRTMLATATAALILPAAASAAEGDVALANLTSPDGTPMGTAELVEGPHGVLVKLRATNLEVGEHGFHIHQTGACSPDFGAAGGHYAPDGSGHGWMHPEGYHAGDLPNIHADALGNANTDVFTDRVTLSEGAESTLFDEDGSAIIIHESPDSYAADAGAGGRVACGVVERR
jgi:Cu-Zn family superoxide dismutase